MAATTFKRNEVLVLLGAGACVEAGIPDSNSMVREIELLMDEKVNRAERYLDLYRYIKSAVCYADGLGGLFGDDVPFNIERLVNCLDQLLQREKHPLYPFVGAWNVKLAEVAGAEFQNVREFRNLIVRTLRHTWIALPRIDNANYFGGLLRFQDEFQHPLRVFSLNYDLCIEQVCGKDNVQRGFMGRDWDPRSFDETTEDQLPIILYKLHGSTDWSFTDTGGVTYMDAASRIDDKDVAIIFGTSYKLQYVDPFLFLAYELRRWTLDVARVLICIGYGFNDEHINGILRQSLRQNRSRKLLAVTSPKDETGSQSDYEAIVRSLDATADQIFVQACGAKVFLENELTISMLSKMFPEEEDLIKELPDA